MFQLFVVRECCSRFSVMSRCRYWIFQLESHFAEGWLLHWWNAPLPSSVQLLLGRHWSWKRFLPQVRQTTPQRSLCARLSLPYSVLGRYWGIWQPLDRSTPANDHRNQLNWLWLSNVMEPHVGSGGARFGYAYETIFADHQDETVMMVQHQRA